MKDSFLLIYILTLQISICTGTEIDSLEKQLTIAQTDSLRVDLMEKLSVLYLNGSPAKAMQMSEEALELSERTGLPSAVAQNLRNIGMVYRVQGNYDKALSYYLQALKKFEQLDDEYNVAITNSKIGIIYYYHSNYDYTIKYYNKALQYFVKIDQKFAVAASLINIGLIYFEQAQYENALKNYEEALVVGEELKDSILIGGALSNIGSVYQQLKEYKLAQRYQEQAADIYRRTGNSSDLAAALTSLGSIYTSYGDHNRALEYLDESQSLSEELGLLEYSKTTFREYSETYAGMLDFKNALIYHKLYAEAKDSLFNEGKSKEIGKLEAKYEFEKAVEEQKRAEQEKAKQLKEITSRRNNLQYSGILIFIVILVTSLFTLGKFQIPIRLAEGLIFFTFLLFFEFTLVLLDPYIEEYSSGAPVLKLGFNAVLAALIFPLHHFFETKVKKSIVAESN